LAKEFSDGVTAIDVAAIHAEAKTKLSEAIGRQDYRAVLSLFDNKGLLADAARILGHKGKKELEEFVGRSLRGAAGKNVRDAFVAVLPQITPRLP
jgi:hypothetical protein